MFTISAFFISIADMVKSCIRYRNSHTEAGSGTLFLQQLPTQRFGCSLNSELYIFTL